MKIAIVHDELVRRGGAEQVTLLMHQAFPDAPIYTSTYNPDLTYDGFKDCKIITSWFSHIAKNEKKLKRFFFPFSIWSMRSMRLKGYDVVFMSTTTCAKYVKIDKGTQVIAFCHYPFRLAWFPESYEEYNKARGLHRLAFNYAVSRIKSIDNNASKQIDWYLTNTPLIKDIIKKCYNPRNEIKVIPASIAMSNFYVAEQPAGDYYLVVSRLESHKKVSLVIKAFNQMPDKKLMVVGAGSEKEKLSKMAGTNILFKEGLSMDIIAGCYANCKALIFPQEEDFGLVPIEANASGRPVIAYGKGGVTYTTIPYEGHSEQATSLFFYEQTPDAIVKAVNQFETLEFNPSFIRNHAEKFSEEAFIDSVRQFVEEKQSNKPENIEF
ncbi:MAG: glycosyltransferase [Bacteroidota bacterium]|nr:glycosyltransferase [Bacteroidota bacterium]